MHKWFWVFFCKTNGRFRPNNSGPQHCSKYKKIKVGEEKIRWASQFARILNKSIKTKASKTKEYISLKKDSGPLILSFFHPFLLDDKMCWYRQGRKKFAKMSKERFCKLVGIHRVGLTLMETFLDPTFIMTRLVFTVLFSRNTKLAETDHGCQCHWVSITLQN